MSVLSHLLLPLTITLLLFNVVGSMSLLLGDLQTPSFVLDLHTLQRHLNLKQGGDGYSLPAIRTCGSDVVLIPCSVAGTADPPSIKMNVEEATDCIFNSKESICYLHCSVTRSREQVIPEKDEPASTFLAELDLKPSLCGDSHRDGNHHPFVAQLVLGLNNHHVGSYYWARSAGAGASMEAPGICFDDVLADGEERGVLRWQTEGGPTECNSNDGKRSEWVNFLRQGDTVQLVPADAQGALIAFCKEFGAGSGNSARVYGVSSGGRPLGSEPQVVCEWKPIQ